MIIALPKKLDAVPKEPLNVAWLRDKETELVARLLLWIATERQPVEAGDYGELIVTDKVFAMGIAKEY